MYEERVEVDHDNNAVDEDQINKLIQSIDNLTADLKNVPINHVTEYIK